jgi:hypothetical protein
VNDTLLRLHGKSNIDSGLNNQQMRFIRQLCYLLGILKEPSLIGVWERIGDDFAGCRLRIEFDGPNLNGRIIKLPEYMEKYGWQHDDAKWMHIQRQTVCRYRFQELYKVLSSQSVTARNLYYHSRLLILSDNVLLSIPPDQTGGRKNRWRRVIDNPKNFSTPNKIDLHAPAYPPMPNTSKRP